MICPKCGHQRTNTDDPLIPDYECPACGIIYAKYKPPVSQSEKKSNSTIENARQAKLQIKPAIYVVACGLILVAVGYIGYGIIGQIAEETRQLEAQQAVITHFLDNVKSRLKDPESAKFAEVQLSANKKVLCGKVNAKNSMGGYTGYELFIATEDGEVEFKSYGMSKADIKYLSMPEGTDRAYLYGEYEFETGVSYEESKEGWGYIMTYKMVGGCS